MEICKEVHAFLRAQFVVKPLSISGCFHYVTEIVTKFPTWKSQVENFFCTARRIIPHLQKSAPQSLQLFYYCWRQAYDAEIQCFIEDIDRSYCETLS